MNVFDLFSNDDKIAEAIVKKIQTNNENVNRNPIVALTGVDEEFEPSPVASAIVRRIMFQHPELLKTYGPNLVNAAIDNVADYVGDVDEIGSSDVSAWVKEVERMLKDNPPEAFAEGAGVAYVTSYFDTKTGDKGESTVSALTREEAADKIVGLMHERGYDITVTRVRPAIDAVDEAIGYESNKAYAEVGPYKRYTVYVTKKKFNEKFGFVAVAVNPRTNDAKFKAAGQTQEEAVNKLQAEVDKEIDVATKVSGAATIDFNVDFVRDVLEMSSNTFYAKIVPGPKLVIAGKEMEQYPDIMKQEGFKASSIRTVGDSEGATKLPAMPLSASGATTAQLVANGRYALGQETIDRDGNRIFDLEFDSVVADPRERIRMGAPAITIGTKREATKEGWQDFNKVEPYEVCLAGKPVKQFDYYEDARRFHDNWKKKLYNQGDKAKADKITLNPIMKEGIVDTIRSKNYARLADRSAAKRATALDNFDEPEHQKQTNIMKQRNLKSRLLNKQGVDEGDDLGHLDSEVFGRIDAEKKRKADLKKNDPAAYARELEKDRKNYGRGIMGALRRQHNMPLDEFAPSPDYNGGGEPDRFPRIPQKFHKGDIVWVSAPKGKSRSHFPGDSPAVVLGSYDDQYGDDMVYVDVDLDDPDLSPEDRKYYTDEAKRKAAQEHQYDIFLLHKNEVGETAWYPESDLTAIPGGTNAEALFTKGNAAPWAKVPAKIKKIFATKLGQQNIKEFAPGGTMKPPAPPTAKKRDPFEDDDRSQLLMSIKQLLDKGAKIDSYLFGARGHITGVSPDYFGFTFKKLNKPHSKSGFVRPMDGDDDDSYMLKLVKPGYYQLWDKSIANASEQGVAEADETSWTANSAQFRKEEDLSWTFKITLAPNDDINQGRGRREVTKLVTGQSMDAAKKKIRDYFLKNGWEVVGIEQVIPTNEAEGSWIVYDPETKQIKKRFKTHTAGKSYAKVHGLGFASSEYYFDNVKQTVAEFAPSPERDDGDEVPHQILTLANRWWNAAGDQPKIESVLRSLGWSIHQVESEDDAVQLMHDDGTTYFISADDFDPEVFEDQSRVDPILLKALKRMPDCLATHHEVLDAAYDAYALELGYLDMKHNPGVTRVYMPKLMSLYKEKHGLTFNEGQTDYQKRRQHERDIDAGKPVARQRQSKQTDYQKKRAQDKKDMEMGEGYVSSFMTAPPADPREIWKSRVRQLIISYRKNPSGLAIMANRAGPGSAEQVAYDYLRHPTAKIPAEPQRPRYTPPVATEPEVDEAISAAGPKIPTTYNDQQIKKLIWDTLHIDAPTGTEAVEKAITTLTTRPQTPAVRRMLNWISDNARKLNLSQQSKMMLNQYVDEDSWSSPTTPWGGQDPFTSSEHEMVESGQGDDSMSPIYTNTKQPTDIKESYWTRLQNERNTKLNMLVSELKESVNK